MINLDTSSLVSVQQFNAKLTEVENGTHYLRVTYQNGHLSYDTTPKAQDFLGRIIQYIVRLFDASYNINRASVLLSKAFSQYRPETMNDIEHSVEALSHIVEHVNECRYIRKIDLSLYLPASFNIWSKGITKTLRQWIKDAPDASEKRRTAAKRILECQKQGKATPSLQLDLSYLRLSSLPPEIWNLTSLTWLDLGYNKLTSLPLEIGRLTSLRDFSVSGNRLTALPEEIGHLTSLKGLDLSDNELAFLPSEIGHWTSLRNLGLQNNQLTALPLEIVNLTSLENFSCYANQLTSLPRGLLNRRDLYIDITNNRFTRQYAEDALLPAARHNPRLIFSIIDNAPARTARALSLPELLAFWYEQAGKAPPEESYWQVLKDHTAVDQLKTFLAKQQNTANFTKGDAAHKRVFGEHLCKLLEAMVTDDDFREKAFEELHHANSSCGDRAAFGLDKLTIIYESLIGVRGKSTQEVASFALGLRRMAMIEEEAGKLGGDQIETALRLQLTLKDYLKLPTVTVAMLYPGISTVDEAGALVIGERIKAATNSRKDIIAALLTQACWETHLRSLDSDKYIELATAVTEGTYDNDDLRKAAMRKGMDELYLADTEKFLNDNPDVLTALSS